VVVGADGAGARLDDEFGVVPFIFQHAAAGEHVLAQAADEVAAINHVDQFAIVEEDRLASQRREVDGVDGAIDGVGDEHLLGGGAHRVAGARAAAAGYGRGAGGSEQSEFKGSPRVVAHRWPDGVGRVGRRL
jgi:hypothetical protein